jgi:hypothetical protein
MHAIVGTICRKLFNAVLFSSTPTMKVYFHDNINSDQRLPHEGESLTLTALERLGVYANTISDQAEVDRIAQDKGYKNRDEVRFILTFSRATTVDNRSLSPQRNWEKDTRR